MLEGSILQKLVANRAEATGSSTLNFGVYYKNTLVALCHALEDYILTVGGSPLVLTAFQQGKWYLEEADRYGAIADVAQQIVIMAAPDAGFHNHPTGQRDNVELVDLDAHDPVAQEWHLIILSPQYTAMVLCQELSLSDYGSQGMPENDLERKFYGFWTFEPDLVHETVEYTIAHIGQYNPALQNRLNQYLHAQTHLDGVQGSTADGISEVVGNVIDYLQSSRRTLLTEGDFSFLEDVEQNLIANNMQAFLRMAQLVDIADEQNPLASREVLALSEMMGQLVDLPVWQMQRLKLACLLHRIAPMPMELGTTEAHTDEDAPSCLLVPGAQMLRRMPKLRAVANIITHQSEWWNGSGQPARLAGDDIPVESRILGLVVAFQQAVVSAQLDNQSHAEDSADQWLATDNQALTTALESCQQGQGERWDPKLVEVLALIVQGLKQGLSLPAIPAKMTVVTGLLDPDTASAERSTSLV
ncbi:MAG: DICT sensory domain-containing protein [Cyanobacteria bacterium P01_H01_bin.119]